MKNFLLIVLLVSSYFINAQSVIQSVNSGSLITANSSVSIGEIVINPVTQNQSSSGLIGILSQVNQQLEVSEFELSENIVVYPNPTESSLSFKSKTDLTNEKVSVYSTNGQLLVEKNINSNNTIDLSELSTGIYLIQLSSDKSKSFKIIKH
jgi:hypothetical protein